MRDTFALYLRYQGISLRAQMQYRASFVMLLIGQLAITGIDFLAVWTLFSRFGNMRGWTLPEIAFFYGMVNIAFSIAEGMGRGFDTFPNLIKRGDFDRLLLRPRGTAFQIAAQEIQLMRAGRLIQAAIVFGWALSVLPIPWNLARALLVIATIGGGVCLFYGLLVFQATMSFWTIESLEIMNTVTFGSTETGTYPLTIYRPWFRRFFTFVVPLACLNYIPARALLPRADLQGIAPWLPWFAPLVGVLFLCLAFQTWKLGVRHYTSTGS